MLPRHGRRLSRAQIWCLKLAGSDRNGGTVCTGPAHETCGAQACVVFPNQCQAAQQRHACRVNRSRVRREMESHQSSAGETGSGPCATALLVGRHVPFRTCHDTFLPAIQAE